MDSWDKLVKELSAHKIKVDQSGQVSISRSGQAAHFSSVSEAIQHIQTKAKENASFLAKLWTEVANLGHKVVAGPSNESTQRLFVAALKFLVKQSHEIPSLKKAYAYMRQMLMLDITMFSEQMMSKVVDYRLAIDWVTHLVAYDSYRAQLLHAFSMGQQGQGVKTAQGFGSVPGGNYAYTEATPWELYELPTERKIGEDPTPFDNEREFRFRSGVKGDSGMEDYDTPTLGKHFKAQQDSLLPQLPTEDTTHQNEYENFSGQPIAWDQMGTDGLPYNQRAAIPGS